MTAVRTDTPVIEKFVKTNGELALRKYSKGRFLGKGGFARCYELLSLDSRKLSAAKIVAKASLTKARAKQKLMSEIKIHRSLHHPHIVAFEHFFEDSENIYILLELCSNQTMNELLRRRKRLTELEVQCYMHQIISSLKFLHANRVIHRDLKLGNLFLSEKMEVKLGDFGLACKIEFDGEKKRTICGTPNYIAPEVLDGKVGHSFEVDVWSLGVIMYTLLIGKPPFETSDVKTTYRRIRMNAYSFPESVSISDVAKSLITRILVADPSKRPSLDEIGAHPFMNPGHSIPKAMPTSTLACAPSSSYLRQYLPISPQTTMPMQRMADTAPAAPVRAHHVELGHTERVQRHDSDPMRVKASSNLNGMETSEVWVKKWVDYSSKYGLGYLLSNGATGVFFNDSTKILLGPAGHRFCYLNPKHAQDVGTNYTLTDYPKDLQKKVTLLQHFRSYLEGDVKQATGFEDNSQDIPLIYVKKWMRTRHAIVFRLSNKLVQVNFQDKTEIVLSSQTRIVTYVNKQGERSSHPLNTALESSNQEMSKRLKYTKDLLNHMFSNSNKLPG